MAPTTRHAPKLDSADIRILKTITEGVEGVTANYLFHNAPFNPLTDVNLSTSYITTRLQQLENDGYVAVHEDPKLGKMYSITHKGELAVSEISVQGTKKIIVERERDVRMFMGIVEAIGGAPIITRKTGTMVDSEGKETYYTLGLARKMDINFDVVRVDPITLKETFVTGGYAGDYLIESREVHNAKVTSVGLHVASPSNGRAWYQSLEKIRFAQDVQRVGLSAAIELVLAQEARA